MSNLICDRIIIFLLMTLVFLHCQQLFEKKNMIYNSGGKEKPVLYKTCAFVVFDVVDLHFSEMTLDLLKFEKMNGQIDKHIDRYIRE